MSKLSTAISLLKNPYIFIIGLDKNKMLKWMPDSMFAKLSFRGMMGTKLHLDNPVTFNEKLQWLKVYDHREEYASYVDKIAAKKTIGEIIGYQHIVPIIDVWDNAEEIDFNSLPSQFVLKCNHDQGSVILVRDKNTINQSEIVKKLNSKLKENTYYGTREYPYKNICPKVFAEKYLGNNIIDYKFYCFNGEPRFLYCGQGLTEDHSLKIDFYDLDWNVMPFYRTDYQRLGNIEKPVCLNEMIEIARKLSKGVPFVRVDLFEIENTVYFSEFTLCPASGFMPFEPPEYDKIVGEWLLLPNK